MYYVFEKLIASFWKDKAIAWNYVYVLEKVIASFWKDRAELLFETTYMLLKLYNALEMLIASFQSYNNFYRAPSTLNTEHAQY